MKVKVVKTSFMDNNTIIIFSDSDAIIIDPSFYKKKIINALEGLNVVAIVMTHGHFDHFASADYLADYYDVPIYAHKNEIKMMQDDKLHLGQALKVPSLKCTNLVKIDEGSLLKFGDDIVLKAIRVEGHTSDSICFYSEADKFLISGDTIFKGSLGRVDFYKNDMALFVKNIKENLLVLPEDTVVYPGHGDMTTIARERKRHFYNESFY